MVYACNGLVIIVSKQKKKKKNIQAAGTVNHSVQA